MAFQVVHKRRGGGKLVVDLTQRTFAPKPAKLPPPKPPVEAKPKRRVTAAPVGPPIAADLPKKFRAPAPWSAQKDLVHKQAEIIDRLVRKAGDGYPETLGLRLVLAAAEDELAAAWPIGLLSKALRVAGHKKEGSAVYSASQGCRVARFKDMAAHSLSLLNQKLEAQKDK